MFSLLHQYHENNSHTLCHVSIHYLQLFYDWLSCGKMVLPNTSLPNTTKYILMLSPLFIVLCSTTLRRASALSLSEERMRFNLNHLNPSNLIVKLFGHLMWEKNSFRRKISGIGVSGSLGYQLSNLKSVKSLWDPLASRTLFFILDFRNDLAIKMT